VSAGNLFAAEIERAVGADRPKSTGARNRYGEWDFTATVSPRRLRRLTGARYFRRDGMDIDDFADLVCRNVPAVDDHDSAIGWWIDIATRALDAAQEARTTAVPWHLQERPADEWPEEAWAA
jgi:hypothetical protein